jgi:hypothetical protein
MLSLERVGTLAAEAARELRLNASVAGITPAGDGSYAEVILTLTQHDKPKRVVVGLDRSQTPREIKAAARAELQDFDSGLET